jgi:hypothetical protein
MRRGISEISEMMSAIKSALSVRGAQEQVEALADFYYKADTSPFLGLDPYASWPFWRRYRGQAV